MSKLLLMKTGLKQAAVALLAVSWMMTWSVMSSAVAGEVRTLSLYQVHTKEKLTVTYKKNGRYIPSAMKKLNHILRDWRRNAVTKIDPKTIDLMWELHADLGSKKPIHIISAYRSAKTNAMLKRIGRRVARRSRHIRGQAIDMFFPDVKTSRVRGSALVRKVGGVGFYPRSGKHGFIHIDSGTVRHWPRVSKKRLAGIHRKYKKTVGARRYIKQPKVMFASASKPAKTKKPSNKGPIQLTPKKLPKPFQLANIEVPKPRNRPMEVIVLAAADVQVTPASAPVPVKNYSSETMPKIRDIATLVTATATPAPEVLVSGEESVSGTSTTNQRSNISAKGSLARDILNGTESSTPTIRPLIAARAQQDADNDDWWPLQFLATADNLFRRDGSLQSFDKDGNRKPVIGNGENAALKGLIASLAPENQIVDVEALRPQQATAISGKADRLEVNRDGKGDLMMPAPISMMKRQSASAAQIKKDSIARLNARAEEILQSSEKPISFE